MRTALQITALVTLGLLPASGLRADEGTEFFENEIRPLLVEHCYDCHSSRADKVKGGLLLDSKAAVLEGGDSGPALEPGDVEGSLLIEAVRHVEGMEMPPKYALAPAEVRKLERWVEMGAPDPRDGRRRVTADSLNIERGREFWAYQPISTDPAPTIDDKAWSSSPIDRHLRWGMAEAGIEPVAETDSATLLRRLSFDLTGLPPTPAQLDAFTADPSHEAYAKAVDHFLDSDAFGERWGRHWLDVARFAESTGQERNVTFPNAWRYRDWVIDAFNNDMPYDDFLRAQIAGDLLEADSHEERDANTIATGFLAVGVKSLNERVTPQFLMDIADDQIDVATRSVLGLTVACARCHDHKFDAFPTEDYYALAGIFQSTETCFGVKKGGGVRHASPYLAIGPQLERRQQAIREHRERLAEATRVVNQRKQALQRERKAQDNNDDHPKVEAARRQLRAAEQRVAEIKRNTPQTPLYTMGVRDREKTADMNILIRGEVGDKGAEVERGFLQVLGDFGVEVDPQQSGRRQLVEWMVHDDNPLTARVMANRVWAHLIGEGIVRTVDNFGEAGERPDNIALLNYLADQLRDEHGWSVKALVREVVMTRAYRSSSAHQAHAYGIDSDNRLVWRAHARRLDSHALRDAMLSACGVLAERPEKSVVAQLGSINIGQVRAKREQLHEKMELPVRSVYLPMVRNELPEFLRTFDTAEPSLVVGKRDATTVATQALYLLNSPFAIRVSDRLARRVFEEAGDDPADRLDLTYKLVLSRSPAPGEATAVLGYVDEARRDMAAAVAESKADPDVRAWSSLAQALFASAEFRTLQ